MPIDYAALRTEIQTDPAALGYATYVTMGSDAGVAALLNAVGVGAGYSIFRNDVASKEIVDSIAPADFTAATALQIAKLTLVLSAGIVDASRANVRGNLQGIFAGASAATTNALTAAVKRQGSRAEVVFGVGTVIAAQDVARALGRP